MRDSGRLELDQARGWPEGNFTGVPRFLLPHGSYNVPGVL